MTVHELIAILQTKDPLCEVVMRDSCNELGYVRVQSVEGVTMRAYARQGVLFLGTLDSDEMLPRDGDTDVFEGVEHGVLLSTDEALPDVDVASLNAWLDEPAAEVKRPSLGLPFLQPYKK